MHLVGFAYLLPASWPFKIISLPESLHAYVNSYVLAQYLAWCTSISVPLLLHQTRLLCPNSLTIFTKSACYVGTSLIQLP